MLLSSLQRGGRPLGGLALSAVVGRHCSLNCNHSFNHSNPVPVVNVAGTYVCGALGPLYGLCDECHKNKIYAMQMPTPQSSINYSAQFSLTSLHVLHVLTCSYE